ncbi:hypothetical protein ACKWTF_003248 [Chironomus riparius]
MCDKVINKISSLWKTKNVETSSFVFKLVTKYTVCMLLLFALIIGGMQLFGESISCFSSGKAQHDVMDYQCWIKNDINLQRIKYGYAKKIYKSEEEKYLKIGFYGWIVPLLLFQAFCFVVPRIHWHYKQQQTIPKALKKLSTNELTDDWIRQRTQLIGYVKNIQKSQYRLFAFRYLSYEFITIVLNILVMLLMNLVIDDFWNVYEPAAKSLLFLDLSRLYQTSALQFPKQANCHFSTYDFKLTRHSDSVCTFPYNGFNAKIFAFLYIWYIFILTWTVLHLLIMIVLFSFQCFRLRLIRRMLGRPATVCECKHLSENGDVGLWFLLRIFRRNMHLAHFQDLCTGLLTGSSLSNS